MNLPEPKEQAIEIAKLNKQIQCANYVIGLTHGAMIHLRHLLAKYKEETGYVYDEFDLLAEQLSNYVSEYVER